MKSLLDRKSGLICSLFVITLSLGTAAQADNRSPHSPSAQQNAGVDAAAVDTLRNMGLQQSPADAERAMQRWQAILVDIGHLDKERPVSHETLAALLTDMQKLAEHVAVSKNHILTRHAQGELSKDTQQFLKYLTSYTLRTQRLSDKNVGDGRYFSRRLNTSLVGEKYHQVTLHKPMRDLISFWQQSPQVAPAPFHGNELSVQQVRQMLERGEIDETLIAAYSLEKAHLLVKQRELYANQ
ncbi:hypothetical protein [Lacimicrobium alkaliphilum]|uniref:Uncharacterized protein n=1 Tax=Lacimicrobium alkaliphilum TaxID=1526571 RepID=A0ABQ1RS36_9ALTE|nr:hypothetical protein [Lacimicrobium alkaliphilum]GGD76278.1 hypothetical protein GCM10011357_34110 [Lacimicrobium alkaliphilum]